MSKKRWSICLARHETVDLDHVGALDLDRFELLVLDDQILALGDLVAAAFVLGIDRLAGFLIDELLTQPIAGRLVDLPEGDALCGRAGGVQCDRARDQGQLEIAFPVGTHGLSPWFRIYAWGAVSRCRAGDDPFMAADHCGRGGPR